MGAPIIIAAVRLYFQGFGWCSFHCCQYCNHIACRYDYVQYWQANQLKTANCLPIMQRNAVLRLPDALLASTRIYASGNQLIGSEVCKSVQLKSSGWGKYFGHAYAAFAKVGCAYIWFRLHVGHIITTVPFVSAGSAAVIRARMLWELVRASRFGEKIWLGPNYFPQPLKDKTVHSFAKGIIDEMFFLFWLADI